MDLGSKSTKRSFRSSNILRSQQKSLYLFILPGLIILIIFNYLPLYGIGIAFKDFNPMVGIAGSKWIGLKHFAKLFDSIFFWRVFKNTLVINLLQLLFGFPAPIILALLLNEIKSSTCKRTVQTITYLPHFLSWVIVGGFVVNVLSPNQEIITKIAEFFTGEKSDIFLLVEPKAFPWIIVFSAIWQSVGWGSIIYIAAISGIDPTIYEAATIDGANRWHQMIYVTLPLLLPTIFVMLILRMGRMMNSNFEQIYVLLNPSVYSTGDVLNTYIFREGLGKGRYSYATAIGFFQSVIGFMLMVIANQTSKKFGRNIW